MIAIIIGILVVVLAIVAVVVSLSRTPDHLEGYYGCMYFAIASIAIIGAIALVLTGLGVF